MNRICLLAGLCLCFVLYSAAQSYPTGFSEPLDLPESGWNRTLLLKDGKTVLIHLEQNKLIRVFIFSKEGEIIAQNKELSAYLDVRQLDKSVFRGFHEINGKPVLFMEQNVDNRNALFRILINKETGKLEQEELIERSSSFSNTTGYYISKSPVSDMYAVMHFRYLIGHPDRSITVSVWNGEHRMIRKAELKLSDEEEKDYSSFSFAGMHLDSRNNITACFNIVRQNHMENVALFAFLPEDATEFSYKKLSLQNVFIPFLVNFQERNNELEALLLAEAIQVTRNRRAYDVNIAVYISFGRDYSFRKTLLVPNSYCSDMLAYAADSTERYFGTPLQLGAHDGKTMIISECAWRSRDHNLVNTMFQDICIRKIDTAGTIISSRTIPFIQYVGTWMGPRELARRQSVKGFFRLSDNGYHVQFVSYDYRNTDKGLALVLNDEFSSDAAKAKSIKFNNHRAEAVKYTIDELGNLKRTPLYASPAEHSFRAVFLESACYDQTTDTYAALASITTDRKTRLCMSWSRLCH